MKLDRAASHSHDAGLAGWISSNDVTLLTMVLVVMIAMFLQSKLVKGAKVIAALHGENSTLAVTLESTKGELDDASTQLQDTHDRLRLTEEQRNKLDQDLRSALGNVTDLNDRLSALVTTKSQLEQQQKKLTQTTESLTLERDQLTRQQQTLGATRDALVKDKTSLTRQLNQIADDLTAKLRLLEATEQQRQRMQQQANELQSIVAGLTAKLNSANQNVTEIKKQAQASQTESATRIQELENKLTTNSGRTEEYLIQLKSASDALELLNIEKRQVETRLTRAEQERLVAQSREMRMNRELVGLKGKLRRVAVLFDASGSMKDPGTDPQSNRWTEAQRIVATWLRYLDVDECVLIVFSSEVRSFPEDGSFARLSGEHGDERRERLLDQLREIEPKGWTNTLGALRTAYQYPEIDTMILFSDGAPTNVNLGRFDAAVAAEIFELCRQHADIPINTIGLGNYFELDLSTFLRKVASITGGAFLGR